MLTDTNEGNVRLLATDWEQKITDMFEACNKSILHRTTLAHCDEVKCQCIYTDASESHWSGTVTQVWSDQHSVPHA